MFTQISKKAHDMPRQQVYGKRSRAIYDPLAAFVSPQRKAVSDHQDVVIAEATEEFSKLEICDGGICEEGDGRRKVLGERSANAVVQMTNPQLEKTKKRRRARRKIVDEEKGEDDDDEEDKPDVENIAAMIQSEEQAEEQAREQKGHVEDEIDEVPLFCDGHGYESEDDTARDTRNAEVEENGVALRQRKQEGNRSVLETPSISISPPTPPAQDEYSEHCAGLLELSSHHMTMFSEWSSQLSRHLSLAKIAEASFGEVYRLSLLEQLPGFSSNDESVFKIIALRPPHSTLPTEKRKRDTMLKKADNMSKPEDVANEVRLLQRMSSTPGFTNFRDVRVVKGRPPQPFVQAFKEFNVSQKARKKEPSNFPDPAKKTSYADNQLWAVIEMQDAGMDLERCVENEDCISIWFVWDVFWQVVLALAKGEEGAEFEHRDLHLGNICVRQPAEKAQDIDTRRKLNFTNPEITIIDYTISRALMPDETVAYHDLAKGHGSIRR